MLVIEAYEWPGHPHDDGLRDLVVGYQDKLPALESLIVKLVAAFKGANDELSSRTGDGVAPLPPLVQRINAWNPQNDLTDDERVLLTALIGGDA